MRILIVSDVWPPFISGVVRTYVTTVDCLRNLGHDVRVISPNEFRTFPCPTYPQLRLAYLARRRMARLIEDLDRERLNLAARCGWTVRGVEEHFCESFGLPQGMTLAGMAAELHRRRGGPAGPTSLETRFITEDLPFGVAPLVRVAHAWGVELPLQQVPLVQKRAIQMARENAKPVIVATQMLESMIDSPVPTRAEASDVATAIYDGADAVMLSAESAAGKHPIEAVRIMNRIIERVEADPLYRQFLEASQSANVPGQTGVPDAVCCAMRRAVALLHPAAIVCATTQCFGLLEPTWPELYAAIWSTSRPDGGDSDLACVMLALERNGRAFWESVVENRPASSSPQVTMRSTAPLSAPPGTNSDIPASAGLSSTPMTMRQPADQQASSN